jgi:hypothetical protein
MPLDQELVELAGFWPDDRPLFVVGGAVRDWVYHLVHGDEYAPKDHDLASQLTYAEVTDILRSRGIAYTEQGAAFGIVAARYKGREYEIASFREEWYDPDQGDGRRPDRVSQGSTPGADAARRDLYINALFYSLVDGEVRDYNDGKGYEDIRLRRVRTVGNPRHRFQEDKLRIPRLIRFFCRYNSKNILHHLDEQTIEAVHEFKHLTGVSGERKLAEFLAGLAKSIKPSAYIDALASFPGRGDEPSLLQSMFPGVAVSTGGVRTGHKCRNPKAVLAWLLRENDPSGLTHPKIGLGSRLKFPSWLTDGIEFLLLLEKWGFDPAGAQRMLRRRDKFHRADMTEQERADTRAEMLNDLADWGRFCGKTGEWQKRVTHFLQYTSPVSAQTFMDKGLEGKALGEALRVAEADAYREDFERL